MGVAFRGVENKALNAFLTLTLEIKLVAIKILKSLSDILQVVTRQRGQTLLITNPLKLLFITSTALVPFTELIKH